jgi:hypothetical protein
VYVDQDPDLILVFDRAAGAASYRQLWHPDPALSVTSVTSSTAVAAAPGTQLVLRQILPLPGQVIPPGSTAVTSGWVSRAQLQRTPAPVVTMTRAAVGASASAAMLTLIAPTAPGVTVSASIARDGEGWSRLRVTVGGRDLTFAVSDTGDFRFIA